MRTAGLRLDRAPPLTVPLRFLLTGPLFGAAAGGLLFVRGAALFQSPYHPETQALVHVVVLGWLTMVMVGALYQILPVAVGQAVPWIGLGRWVHAALAIGVVALALGLALASPPLLIGAIALLGAGLGTALAQFAVALWRAPARSPMAASIRLAVGSLGAVVLLGLVFALEHALGWFPTARQAWMATHLVWGLAGWMGALITGVGYAVLPMFYLAPPFPVARSWWVCGCLAATVAVAPVVLLAVPGQATWAVILAPAGVAWGLFAWTVLQVLRDRKRKTHDPTMLLWLSGLGFAGVSLVAVGIHAAAPHSRWLFAFGAAYLVGAVGSIELGMLYKIVPFLTWLHVYSRRVGKEPVPMVRDLLDPSRAAWQGMAHLGAAGLMLVAAINPLEVTVRIAGTALLLSTGLAWWLLWRAARSPRQREIEDLCSSPSSPHRLDDT